MTRRLQPCSICTPEGPSALRRFTRRRGYTRHANRICAACRRGTPTEAESRALLARFRGRAA